MKKNIARTSIPFTVEDGNEHLHKTRELLKIYRVLVQHIEKQERRVRNVFSRETSYSLEDFIELGLDAGIDIPDDYSYLGYLYGNIQHTVNRISLLNACLDTIKECHPQGDLLYDVIHLQYISPETAKMSREEKMAILQDKYPGKINNSKAYHRKIQQAEDLLSELLWGPGMGLSHEG